MKVRVGQVLVYYPNLLDRVDGRTGLQSGDVVKVINLPGCPKANTMGHCYVELLNSADGKKYVEAGTQGAFGGLVHTNSLHTKAEYADYLRREIAKHEAAVKCEDCCDNPKCCPGHVGAHVSA